MQEYVALAFQNQDFATPEHIVTNDENPGQGNTGPPKDQCQHDVNLDEARQLAATTPPNSDHDSSTVSCKGQLDPRTITVADASPASLLMILDPPIRQQTLVGSIDIQKPVAYNARLPHPAVLYAALGGKDVDLSEYFDENGVFVDIMYRRVGHGGRKVLLQDGEAVTFPTVKDTVSPTLKDSETTSTCDTAIEHDSIAWKDDYVFGKSTTSGMTWPEANSQMQLLREIHATAQQMVTGDDHLLQQAKDLIRNVAALVHLTETVNLRQNPPAPGYKSVSEHDSGRYGKDQKKRSKKISRRADHRGKANDGAARLQPRHLGCRSSGAQMPYTWSSVPQGCPPMFDTNYAFGSPSPVSPVSYPYSIEHQQPYYAAPSDHSSPHVMASTSTASMWQASVCLLSNMPLVPDVTSSSVL